MKGVSRIAWSTGKMRVKKENKEKDERIMVHVKGMSWDLKTRIKSKMGGQEKEELVITVPL